MRLGSCLSLALLLSASPSWAQESHGERQCFSDAVAREKVESEKLMEPFPLMRAAANEHHAEAIKVRLCRNGKELVYEIDLLRRDGHLIHAAVDAATGKQTVAHESAAHEKK